MSKSFFDKEFFFHNFMLGDSMARLRFHSIIVIQKHRRSSLEACKYFSNIFFFASSIVLNVCVLCLSLIIIIWYVSSISVSFLFSKCFTGKFLIIWWWFLRKGIHKRNKYQIETEIICFGFSFIFFAAVNCSNKLGDSFIIIYTVFNCLMSTIYCFGCMCWVFYICRMYFFHQWWSMFTPRSFSVTRFHSEQKINKMKIAENRKKPKILCSLLKSFSSLTIFDIACFPLSHPQPHSHPKPIEHDFFSEIQNSSPSFQTITIRTFLS